MIARDLINYMIPPLKPTDEVGKARLWMDELRLNELPVVEDGRFLGVLDEELLLNEETGFHLVGDYPLLGQESLVKSAAHYYDVLKISNLFGYRLVAVVDEFNSYQGVISIADVVEAFAKGSTFSTNGAILALRMGMQDYSLAQISRLVESHDAKVLSSHLSAHPEDPAELQLTLKINKEDVSYITASLEQNGYHVERSFNTALAAFDERERIDGLMKFIKI